MTHAKARLSLGGRWRIERADLPCCRRNKDLSSLYSIAVPKEQCDCRVWCACRGQVHPVRRTFVHRRTTTFQER